MKNERRHDLETNELAAGLTQWIKKFKPYTGQMITGLILLIGVYIGLAIWDSYGAQRERDAWDAFALASDTNDRELKGLQRVAGDEKHAGTKMQEWAYVGWADRQVLLAQQTYLIDRESANDRLRNALGIYEGMASDASDPQVRNRARFGLARVYELQNKLEEARQQYLLVRGDLEPQAGERAKQLESEEVREACNWLATAELPRRDLTGGQGTIGARPDFDAATPSADAGAAPKSLEDLLGEFNSETPSEERYEKESGDEATEETQPAVEDDSSADKPSADSPSADSPSADSPSTGDSQSSADEADDAAQQ